MEVGLSYKNLSAFSQMTASVEISISCELLPITTNDRDREEENAANQNLGDSPQEIESAKPGSCSAMYYVLREV